MVDQHPFIFQALTQVDNNTFLFQQHFKAAFNILPFPARACLFPFEQFIEEQMVQLQNSILERLHHHTLSNMCFDATSKAHYAQILSCFGPKGKCLTYNLINLPPNSLKDSTMSSKVKTMTKKIQVYFLIRNISGVRNVCYSSKMGIRMNDKRVNYLYGPAQTKQQVGYCII
jgi:hypothetical protein